MNRPETGSPLGGLHRNRLIVGTAVMGVALAMDAFDPVPGHRPWLITFGVLFLVSAFVFDAVAGSVPRRRLVIAELMTDLFLATGIVALTGGISGEFVVLFPLVAVAGGMLLGFHGGTLLGFLSAAAFGCVALGGPSSVGSPGFLAPPVTGVPAQLVFYPVFFVAVGMLSGLLGDRMAENEQALARKSREVEQLRLDTESIVQNLSSGLLTIDALGRVIHFNEVAEGLLGFRAEDVRGKKLGMALGEGARELVEKVQSTLDEGIPMLRAEVRLQRSGGESLPVGVSTSVLLDGNDVKSGVVALFQDLTEVRRLEEASRRRDRLTVIGGMAASIAHEVRNCVNPISGSVEMLEQELHLEGENARLLDLIGREAARMERFVSELLSYSRGTPMKMQEVGIKEMIERTMTKTRSHPSYRPTVSLRCRFESADTVRVDPEQLEQVFFNLALNALEAMGPVGSLTVTVSSAAGHVLVEFADTGMGMNKETLDRVFEPFYSTKESGTGLGLAIAHRIVERHEGRMEVISHPGNGTRVRVSLRMAGAESSAVEHMDVAA